VAGSNISCSECHSHLKVSAGSTPYATNIRTLEDGHPEIAALRNNFKDPGTILLNHSIHMKPIRRGPNGPLVQMECADCHRPEAVKASWPTRRKLRGRESQLREQGRSSPGENPNATTAPRHGPRLYGPIKILERMRLVPPAHL